MLLYTVDFTMLHRTCFPMTISHLATKGICKSEKASAPRISQHQGHSSGLALAPLHTEGRQTDLPSNVRLLALTQLLQDLWTISHFQKETFSSSTYSEMLAMDSMEFLLINWLRPDFYSYFVTYSIIYRWKIFIGILQAWSLQGVAYIPKYRERGTTVCCEQICLERHVKLSYEATLGTGIWHKQLEGSNALNQSRLFCIPSFKWFKSSVWKAGAGRH